MCAVFWIAHGISNHKCLQYTNLVPSVRIYAFNQSPYYGYFLDLPSKDICRPTNQSVDGSCFLSVFLSVSPTVCLSISRRPTIQPSSQSVCLPTGAHQPVSVFVGSQSVSQSFDKPANQPIRLPSCLRTPACLSVCLWLSQSAKQPASHSAN